MNNYTKGRNEEEAWQKEKIPISDLPKNFVWMQVTGSSKIRNLLEAAWRKFDTVPYLVWSGSGPAITKVITCAEMTKRKYNELKQKTSICYRVTKEYWDPKIENLDQLVVKREIPTIHIYLYKQ